MFIKLKSKDADQFRKLSAIVRQSNNHFLNRFVKELFKQGYLVGNTTLPRNLAKNNHQLLQNTFNWTKPNVTGATSIYNFRKRDSENRVQKKQKQQIKNKWQIKEETQQSVAARDKKEYDALSCHKVSPPKSQAPGIKTGIFPKHGQEKQADGEEKSSINNEILREAQPVTSVLNFYENDESAGRGHGEVCPSSKLLVASQLDETMIAQAPTLIQEHILTDLPGDEQVVDEPSSRSKGKSATTQASELKSSDASFLPPSWKLAVGLDPKEEYSDNFMLSHLISKLSDEFGSTSLNGTTPLQIFSVFVAPLLSKFQFGQLEQPSDSLTSIINLLSLLKQYPGV